MSSPNSDEQSDWTKLYHFTKLFTYKVAQIVVHSRKGKSCTYENRRNSISINPSSNSQPFNLAVPDEPEVTMQTHNILNADVHAEIVTIEISLRTAEGDEMVLEYWTMKLLPSSSPGLTSISTIYHRMSTMLKSVLCVSRVTPAYKISREQSSETYKIFYKVYAGLPDPLNLGEQQKIIKVSELCTPIGTIRLEVIYRLKMTITPDKKLKASQAKNIIGANRDVMLKSDHFLVDSVRKNQEKSEPDLTRPLRLGAFTDSIKIKKLQEILSQQMPQEPPMSWMLRQQGLHHRIATENVDIAKPGSSQMASYSAPNIPTTSKAIEVPKLKNENKFTSLMEFPFAEGSPIAELANFYEECVRARAASDSFTDFSPITDTDTFYKQLKVFEDAINEFDAMVDSMHREAEFGKET